MMIALLACAIVLGPPRADDAAVAIFKAAQAKLAAASSVTGAGILLNGENKTTYRFRLSRPDLVDVATDHYEIHSDGRATYMYFPEVNQYRANHQARRSVLEFYGFEPVVGGETPEIGTVRETTFAGKAAIKAELAKPGAGMTTAYFYDKATQLPLGWTMSTGSSSMTFTYSNVKLGPAMDVTTFDWTRPAGSTLMGDVPELLNKEAPDFTNSTSLGEKVNLKKTLGKSKVLLLNFWYYG